LFNPSPLKAVKDLIPKIFVHCPNPEPLLFFSGESIGVARDVGHVGGHGGLPGGSTLCITITKFDSGVVDGVLLLVTVGELRGIIAGTCVVAGLVTILSLTINPAISAW
jgi:hypothetical protein